LLLLAPPVIFLGAIVSASLYFGIITGGDPQAIATQTTQATPYILLTTQVCLALLGYAALRADKLTRSDIGWPSVSTSSLGREVLIGLVPGAALGLVYVTWLSPLLTFVQQTLGDYVPAGELLPTVGASVLPFFLTNVVFAPFVEESIYRGYAFARLGQRFSPAITLLITCLFFGLLHWAGGFWYTLLTGIVAGGLFGGLRLWRPNIVASFTAHLVLNLIEFVFVWLWLSA
jgi:membrane protease YdiL (CAAX protease family)